MPKITNKKRIKEKIIHPNSRKALQLARKEYHTSRLQKRKEEFTTKQKTKLDRFNWFRKHIDLTKTQLVPADVLDLATSEHLACVSIKGKNPKKEITKKRIYVYLRRFDGELEQIGILKNIRKKQTLQHASRHDSIRFTLDSEKEEYATVGLEIPDLLNKRNFAFFKVWNGEPKYLQTIKTKQFNQQALERMVGKSKMRQQSAESEDHLDVSMLFEEAT